MQDDSISFNESSTTFIDEWLRRYNNTPILPRPMISDALEDVQFWGIITSVVPNLSSEPQPATLAKWLIRHENIPFYDNFGERYRFTRAGHRWCLVRFPFPHDTGDSRVAA